MQEQQQDLQYNILKLFNFAAVAVFFELIYGWSTFLFYGSMFVFSTVLCPDHRKVEMMWLLGFGPSQWDAWSGLSVCQKDTGE